MKIVLSLCALMAAALCFAQSPFTAVTFTSAAGSRDQAIVLSSVAGIAAGTELFSGHEGMTVIKITGSSVTVQRGVDGTRASSHLAGDVVYAGTAFSQRDPQGACSLAASALPEWIYPANGSLWSCTAGIWQPFIGALRPVYADAAGDVTIAGKYRGDGSALTGVTAQMSTACTIASLPASPSQGQQCYFSDALTVTDCTSGGGTAKSFCIYDGAAWAKP
jgi:hypothetical protein